jgi:alkylhydroperoxidase family enzyme
MVSGTAQYYRCPTHSRNPIEDRMDPMFLPGVESSPQQDSPYTPLIEAAREAGREYPKIWHLFAFKPHATQHLARFTQEILREEAPLSPGFRELIAARTSGRNDCLF